LASEPPRAPRREPSRTQPRVPPHAARAPGVPPGARLAPAAAPPDAGASSKLVAAKSGSATAGRGRGRAAAAAAKAASPATAPAAPAAASVAAPAAALAAAPVAAPTAESESQRVRQADALLRRVEAHAAARRGGRGSDQLLGFAASSAEIHRDPMAVPPTDSAFASERGQSSGDETAAVAAAVAAATAALAVRTTVAVVVPGRRVPPPRLQLSKLPVPVVEEGRPDAQPPTPIGDVIARITGDPGAEHELRARYNRSRAGLSNAAPEQPRSEDQLRRGKAEEKATKLRGYGPSTAAAAAAPAPEAERLQPGAAAATRTQGGALEPAGRSENGRACVEPRAGGCYQCIGLTRISASTAGARGDDPLYSA